MVLRVELSLRIVVGVSIVSVVAESTHIGHISHVDLVIGSLKSLIGRYLSIQVFLLYSNV